MGAMVPPALLSAAGTAGTAASFLNPLTIGLGVAGIGASLFGGLNQASATRQAGDDYLKAALLLQHL